MRILHVIDPSAPGGGACTLRLLAGLRDHAPDLDSDVLVFGHARHARLARRCGLDPLGRIPYSPYAPRSAARRLRRFLRFHERARGRYDVIHAWTTRAAAIAAQATGERPRLTTATVGPVTGFATHVETRRLERRPRPLLVSSSAVQREFRTLGLARSSVSVLPPAIDSSWLEPWPREVVRDRWEVGGEEFVIGLLSEPASWADARTAAIIVTRLIASGREVRVLLHHGAARRVDAERWMRLFGRNIVFIVDDEAAEPWRVVRGLDAALLIGGELNAQDLSDAGSPYSMLVGGGRRLRPLPGIMPLLWAMAGGVPVVAEASDAVHDIVEEGRTGLLVRQRDINAACDRLARLFDDRTIAGRIGTSAREHVEAHHDPTVYARRVVSAYENVLEGRPVVIDDGANDPVVERLDPDTAQWTTT